MEASQESSWINVSVMLYKNRERMKVPGYLVRPKFPDESYTVSALIGNRIHSGVKNPADMKATSHDVPTCRSRSYQSSIEFEKTDGGDNQLCWIGWQQPVFQRQWLRLSCWIKFIGFVPLASENFGLKLHGDIQNSWLEDMTPDTWTWISAVAVPTGGDANHIILTFDSVNVPCKVLFTGLELEVLDSNLRPPLRVSPDSEAEGRLMDI
eukprot:TRINITY_DN11274_c0_g1_i1.p1 TRINITY_DN11274_c0_g1~~TRINITY_DN11274_c0_g1_i1.p1  ORF type:complete len:227 (+),score=36.09 TRINITY_DN11274_c0_g1_i1:56-682(+)